MGDATPPWLRTAGGFAWRFLVIVAAVGIVVFAILQVKIVLIAVFLALVATSVLEHLVTWFARFMPRALGTVVSLIVLFATFGGLLTYVVMSVSSRATAIVRDFGHGLNRIVDFLENGPLPFTITGDDINRWISQAQQWALSHSGDIAGTVFANVGSVAIVFMILALSLFLTIFFLTSGQNMWIWFLDQIPVRNRRRTHEAAAAGWYTFSGYARGTVIIAAIDAVLAYILLAIVGVPLAAPLSVLVFIGAFIPIVGAPLAMIIAAVVALAANGPGAALIVTLGIAGIGQLEGHVLQPLIMGKQVSLHPVVVALGVTAGTVIGGLLGAVLAIPVLAVSWAVFSKLRTHYPPLTEPLPTISQVMTPEFKEQAEEKAAIEAEAERDRAYDEKVDAEEHAAQKSKRHPG